MFHDIRVMDIQNTKEKRGKKIIKITECLWISIFGSFVVYTLYIDLFSLDIFYTKLLT